MGNHNDKPATKLDPFRHTPLENEVKSNIVHYNVLSAPKLSNHNNNIPTGYKASRQYTPRNFSRYNPLQSIVGSDNHNHPVYRHNSVHKTIPKRNPYTNAIDINISGRTHTNEVNDKENNLNVIMNSNIDVNALNIEMAKLQQKNKDLKKENKDLKKKNKTNQEVINSQSFELNKRQNELNTKLYYYKAKYIQGKETVEWNKAIRYQAQKESDRFHKQYVECKKQFAVIQKFCTAMGENLVILSCTVGSPPAKEQMQSLQTNPPLMSTLNNSNRQFLMYMNEGQDRRTKLEDPLICGRVVKLYMLVQAGSGLRIKTSQGTGTILAVNGSRICILTAGHCVCNRADQKYYQQIRVEYKENGKDTGFCFQIDKVITHHKWNTHKGYDIAVAIGSVDKHVVDLSKYGAFKRNTNMMDILLASYAPNYGALDMAIVGYDGSKDGVYGCSSKGAKVVGEEIETNFIDADHGQSGGPMLAREDGKFLVFGIITSETNINGPAANYVSKLSEDKILWILSHVNVAAYVKCRTKSGIEFWTFCID